MAGLQEKFDYDVDSLNALKTSISEERLGAFLEFAEGDLRYAIALYEWNAKVSESLYTLIHGLEVTLRNAIHREMAAFIGCDRWYDHCPLAEEEKRHLEKTKQRLIRDKKELTSGRVVAGLTFGFWTGLTDTRYTRSLWDKCLYRCFAVKIERRKASGRLTTIRRLRNRIAHFEPVIGKTDRPRNLKIDAGRIIETISWICPVTAKWVTAKSTFDDMMACRPKKPEPLLPLAEQQEALAVAAEIPENPMIA